MTRPHVDVRPATAEDRAWMTGVLTQRWGATTVVSRGRVHAAHELPAFIARLDGSSVGLATYWTAERETELVTLDALVERRGVGDALLVAVANAARSAGSRRLWLVTTNDNLNALRFYQRRGLRVVAVHVGVVDEARRLKPRIPLVGDDGIPLHDEFELAASPADVLERPASSV